MKLEKRDCGIKISLVPCGGCMSVYFDFYGTKAHFNPHESVSSMFGALLTAVYALFEEEHDFHDEWKWRRFHSTKEDGIYGVSTRVEWDNEGTEMELVFTHFYDATEVDIEIERSDKKGKTKITVDSRDLCYAIGKACTDVLKSFGFYGYHFSTEGDHFVLHRLLFMKAYGMNITDVRQLKEMNEWRDTGKTDFAKEMELLLFDM